MLVKSILLGLLLGCVQPAIASSCPAYPAGIWKFDTASALDFEQKWLEILNRKDVAALDCILAPDFADTSRKGKLRPRDQVLQELTQRKEQDQYKQKLIDLQASLFGDTAVVRGVNVVSDQQGHEVLRMRFTDVLHYIDGHWLAVSAQETDEAGQH
jgi:ketosteroid isomerase-like protein